MHTIRIRCYTLKKNSVGHVVKNNLFLYIQLHFEADKMCEWYFLV